VTLATPESSAPTEAPEPTVSPAAQDRQAASPPIEAEASAAPERRVFIAVDGPADATDAEPGAQRSAERRLVENRLADAVLRSTWAALPAWGLCMAAAAIPAGLALWPVHPAVAGGTTLGWMAIAALLWALPRRKRHRVGPGIAAGELTRGRILRLVGAASLVVAGAPWLAVGTPASAPAAALLMLACSIAAIAGVVCLSAWQRLAQAVALVPLSPALAIALDSSGAFFGPPRLAPFALGLAVCATGSVLLRLRHRAWRQNTRALIEQGARLRALESERDAAWQADQDKSRFLAIASHDLRQPVHALGLFAATLHKRLQHTDDEPLARNLMRAIDGLERSFNAMMDISRLDAGVMTPRLQTFPLRDMFRRLHMHYAGQAELAGLGLRFSPGGKSVTSDPQLLERIVGNLIQNAIKYTERGGIVVVARSTPRYVNIEIWDTGVGIAPDLLPRVFEEFYQVGRGERDRTHGLGMGLSIVKRLAQLLNHRLVISSRAGHGTMFRVGVPIGQLPGIQEDIAPADTLPMVVTTPRMVLVIDDEEPIREGLRLLLEEWGYQAMTAADGAQAEHATMALEGHVDLVLSDLHLGDGPDGLEAIASVRRLCGHDVAAILVTGDTAHDEIQRITASGLPVLFKPVQPRRLFEALRSTLN
jgi:signal transduction histidine kinase/CheY-like chemotaxis protein